MVKTTLEQDWERLKTVYLKAKDRCPAGPGMFIYAHIVELRKLDNRGIDFVIRRLFADPDYSQRIKLHGGPPISYPRYPLRVTHWRMSAGTQEYKYYLIDIPELRRRDT